MMIKNFDTRKFDLLIERLSVIAMFLVVLAVVGGFVRLALDHWSYLIPLFAVVVGGVYLIRKSDFRF
jgi:hypothetical protein